MSHWEEQQQKKKRAVWEDRSMLGSNCVPIQSLREAEDTHSLLREGTFQKRQKAFTQGRRDPWLRTATAADLFFIFETGSHVVQAGLNPLGS